MKGRSIKYNLYLTLALWFSQAVWVSKCSGEVCKFLRFCACHSLLSPSISALFCLVNSEVWHHLTALQNSFPWSLSKQVLSCFTFDGHSVSPVSYGHSPSLTLTCLSLYSPQLPLCFHVCPLAFTSVYPVSSRIAPEARDSVLLCMQWPTLLQIKWIIETMNKGRIGKSSQYTFFCVC